MEWLLAPIDAARAHEVGFAVSWHARVMTLAWGVLAPLAVLIARYFKVLPGQNWPEELDTQVWWRAHWMGQAAVVGLTLLGLVLILGHAQGNHLHRVLGYVVILLALVQVAMGFARGSKGGPTDLAQDGSLRGDHYDMTPWRVMFEWLHKGLGYLLLVLALATLVSGLWYANAPRWMWLVLSVWWSGLIVLAWVLQHRGWAIDTYQAIWGPSLKHPGNRRKPIGLGVRRVTEEQPGE